MYGFDVDFALNYRSCAYDRQCSLVGHVLRREDGYVLRRTLHLEVDGQSKKGRPKRTWKKQVEVESLKVGMSR